MREFILFARKALTKPFDLNDLVNANRMDLVARTISNALFYSHGIRKDTIIYASLNGPPRPPVFVKFDGSKIYGLLHDEKSIAKIINECLRKAKSEKEIEVTNGVFVSRLSFEEFIKSNYKEKVIYYLHENGEDIRKIEISDNNLFILGDHIGLPKKLEKFLIRLGAKKVSLGPISYLSSQCVTIVHNELDRRKIYSD
jgi:Uncharacterized conserved protein